MVKSSDKLPPGKITYFDSLDTVSKDRYLTKLSLINKTDPYTIEKKQWSIDMEEIPGIMYPDIVNYLLNSPSSYTLESLKAYESLEAYNQLVCGWVREVATAEINSLKIIKAKVMHWQRMNETPLKPWIIAEKGGKILSAHWDCMAGLGEACTHIAATLFWVDATVRIRETKTVTADKAYWMLPGGVKKVEYSPLSEIDFTSAKSKKVILDKKINNEEVKNVPKRTVHVPTPTADEMSNFFKDLSMTGSKPAILSVKPPYSDNYVPAPLSKKFPKVLTDLYSQDAVSLGFEDLKQRCDSISVSVNKEEAQNVFEETKQQHKSKIWFCFRAGRITASKMKSVCRTKISKPSQSLVKSICYPNEQSFSNAATQWGRDHEKCGIEEYTKTLSETHETVQVTESGLFLNPAYPHLGASPDGLVACDCCGEGCIEVKCPFCVRDSELDKTVADKTCLKMVDGNLQLDKNHAYYYQVQTQFLVCDKEYVDFVVWTMKGLHIERIEPDLPVIEEITLKSSELFKTAILPELVGKYFSCVRMPLQSLTNSAVLCSEASSDKETPQLFCICKGPEEGEMIQCDNENCKTVWFHFECMKIKRAPKENGSVNYVQNPETVHESVKSRLSTYTHLNVLK